MRAGRRSRTQARIARDRFFRANAVLFTLAVLGYGFLAALTIELSLGWLRPYLIGAAVTGGVWFFSELLSLGDVRRFVMGAEGERWTSKELRRLGGGWRVIDGVEFADGDVDHVLVGPGGVFAVETKWSNYECDLDREQLPWGIQAGLVQAADSARRIKLFLQTKGASAPVQPLLVIWGPKVERAPRGYADIGSVRVCVGAQCEAWRSSLNAQLLYDDKIQDVAQALESYVREHRPYELRARMSVRFGKHASSAPS